MIFACVQNTFSAQNVDDLFVPGDKINIHSSVMRIRAYDLSFWRLLLPRYKLENTSSAKEVRSIGPSIATS